MDKYGRAAYAAVEVLIWQLVSSGALRAEPLAAELGRYAGFSGNAVEMLRVLSQVSRAAADPTPLISMTPRRRRRRAGSTIGEVFPVRATAS